MDNMTEYKKIHKRAERELKSGKREDLIDCRFIIDFKSKRSAIPKFKKYYKDKLTNSEQELLFSLCIDMLMLIENDKSLIEQEGVFTKNCTGVIKVHPAKKELKEDIKVFMNTLESLNNSLNIEVEDDDLDSWLNG